MKNIQDFNANVQKVRTLKSQKLERANLKELVSRDHPLEENKFKLIIIRTMPSLINSPFIVPILIVLAFNVLLHVAGEEVVPWHECSTDSKTYCFGTRSNDIVTCIPQAKCDMLVLINESNGVAKHRVYLKNIDVGDNRLGSYYLTETAVENKESVPPPNTMFAQVKTGTSTFNEVLITQTGKDVKVNNEHGLRKIGDVIHMKSSVDDQPYSQFTFESQTSILYWPEFSDHIYSANLSNVFVNLILRTDPDSNEKEPRTLSHVQTAGPVHILEGFHGAGYEPPGNDKDRKHKMLGLIAGLVFAAVVLGGFIAYYIVVRNRHSYSVVSGNIKVPFVQPYAKESMPEIDGHVDDSDIRSMVVVNA